MWLRTDERRDVIASLKMCLIAVIGTRSDLALWKWAILSLHNALQGAMVCHLSGTAQLGALSEKCAYEWLKWYEKDASGEIERVETGVDEFGVIQTKIVNQQDLPPKEHLATPLELFKRLYSDRKRIESGCGSILPLSQTDKKSFSVLNAFRNEFTHFSPKGWSIETEGLAVLFSNNLNILEKIFNDPWPFRHMNNDDNECLRKTLADLREELKKL
ncbi:hypothetical protein OVA03_05560 [Asticcacaulis sp. SL142]|uniref:hypothetical protein n=1 Tax=Asticcacaulis sp. SL142 TaxID=2995155 RepID=UPI00226CB9CB|nr:hypothetical protein [Asticcacaulis sp. SL142]WAC49375.1 hypothetical protein OVA03_05560 [Asticcacaulis sp. SL142]